jgi:hypothetical protein
LVRLLPLEAVVGQPYEYLKKEFSITRRPGKREGGGKERRKKGRRKEGKEKERRKRQLLNCFVSKAPRKKKPAARRCPPQASLRGWGFRGF